MSYHNGKLKDPAIAARIEPKMKYLSLFFSCPLDLKYARIKR
jgi:hypothetical protein